MVKACDKLLFQTVAFHMISQKMILGPLMSSMQAPDSTELTCLPSGQFYARVVLLNLIFCTVSFSDQSDCFMILDGLMYFISLMRN